MQLRVCVEMTQVFLLTIVAHWVFPHLSYTYKFESYDQIMKGISNVNSKKMIQQNDIQQNDLPTKLVNENKDVTGYLLQHNFHKLSSASAFTQASIYVDLTTIHRKKKC